MKIIVLTGLLSVEKANLAHDLADKLHSTGRVVIIDNLAHLRIEGTPEIDVSRLDGDITDNLTSRLDSLSAEVIIIAASEQTHPERLFVMLDDLREAYDQWDIYTLALIDTRTCECFPNLRSTLEAYADASVMMPYHLDDILAYVDND